MAELPRVPAAGLFYGRDLAYVHDAAFGHLARGAGGYALVVWPGPAHATT